VEHGVALPDADGDKVPVEDRLPDSVPQGVGVEVPDREVAPG
jgi:hypothetical protein